jgi:hypothetical protein
MLAIITVFFLWSGFASTLEAQEPPPRPSSVHPLPPGVYEIKPIHSNLCLTHDPAAWPRVPHLVQRPCTPDPPDAFPTPQRHHVIPAPGGGYFIQVNAASECATVARGVVIGPASIDVVTCGGSVMSCSVSADQIFTMRFIAAGPGQGLSHIGDVYEVRTPNNECWDIQGGSSNSGVDAIRWACNNQTNQRFRFKYIAPLTLPGDLACARRAGW